MTTSEPRSPHPFTLAMIRAMVHLDMFLPKFSSIPRAVSLSVSQDEAAAAAELELEKEKLAAEAQAAAEAQVSLPQANKMG